jgi:hypothetical protein
MSGSIPKNFLGHPILVESERKLGKLYYKVSITHNTLDIILLKIGHLLT